MPPVRPVVLGHRGAPRVAPENTLPSFAAAIAQGAVGVELDVRLARSGELVVVHDARLGRLCGTDVRVASSSAWILGRTRVHDTAPIPTLQAVFTLLAGRIVNVEAKADDGDPHRLALALVRELRTHAGRHVHVLVSSFEPRVLSALARHAPDVKRGLLVPPSPLEATDVLTRGWNPRPHAIHPHYRACSRESVSRWKSAGLAVNVWTVDSPDEARRLAALGVDAIITNEPATIVSALG